MKSGLSASIVRLPLLPLRRKITPVCCHRICWTDARRALEGSAQWVSPAGPGGHGRLSGEDGGSDPADLGAWRVGPARAHARAAVAQPPEPLGPPDEDQVA